jgi:hypothetical protein
MKNRSERNRIDKENYRQQKRINKAAKKQNKGRYDTNELGSVFGEL